MEVGINFFIALLRQDTKKKPQKPYKMTSADIFLPLLAVSCKAFHEAQPPFQEAHRCSCPHQALQIHQALSL